MELKEIFRKKFRKARLALKKSQGQLAESLGTTSTSIYRYEKDGISPNLELLATLSQQHNINLNWLLTENDDGEIFIRRDTPSKEELLQKLFPDIPIDTEIIELIESLEIPIVKSTLIAKHLECKWNYKDIIAHHLNEKKK